MCTMARMVAYHLPDHKTGQTFLEYDKLTSNTYTFLASTQTEVSRDFYDLLDQASFPQLDLCVRLGYIGGSSLNSQCQVRELESGKVLANNTNTVVTVDKTTRKPTPVATWWKEKYQDHAFGNERLIIQAFTVPEKTSKYETRVPWSEVDGYKHTNYLSYIRFCLDAGMDAMTRGELSKFSGDIYTHHVKKMQTLYKGETKAGDVISISTWEDTEDPFKVRFDMKKDGATVFQCSMEFFEPRLS